jgi:Pro-kumamolisin, activation domain
MLLRLFIILYIFAVPVIGKPLVTLQADQQRTKLLKTSDFASLADARNFHENAMKTLSRMRGGEKEAASTIPKKNLDFLARGPLLVKKPNDPAATQSHVFMEKAILPSERTDIVKQARASPDVEHEVAFLMKPRNMDKLERLVNEISDPQHPKYGQHLTQEQLTQMTGNKVAKVSPLPL